ncbi:hypothetical protein [Jatrophihabitans sp. GAS493]|uniref:hypothetical protein n=1 Tax=Jatrophihabitans sp. GAS493 TaxID=1907575 RepID=UPI0012FDBFAF|nr:hypothetical protein [Jatrophihabitans sp. GAS493]
MASSSSALPSSESVLATPQSPPSRPLSRGVRVGLVLFAIGLVFIVINVIPFFFGTTDRPLWLNLACLAAPAGLVTAVVSAWRSGRAAARQAAHELAE